MTHNESDIKHFVRGGQIFLHNLRMLNQVIKKVGFLSILLFIITSSLFFYFNTTEYERYLCLQYLIAKCYVLINVKAKQSFINPDGKMIQVLSSQILQAQFIEITLNNMISVIVKALMVG